MQQNLDKEVRQGMGALVAIGLGLFLLVELAKELALFFNGIYVPRAVQLEVNRKHRFRYKLQKLHGTGIYAKCLLADKTNVDLHRIEVDDGEAEGPAQAQERNADAFLGDESRAREIGMNLGLRPVGTVLHRTCQ